MNTIYELKSVRIGDRTPNMLVFNRLFISFESALSDRSVELVSDTPISLPESLHGWEIDSIHYAASYDGKLVEFYHDFPANRRPIFAKVGYHWFIRSSFSLFDFFLVSKRDGLPHVPSDKMFAQFLD